MATVHLGVLQELPLTQELVEPAWRQKNIVQVINLTGALGARRRRHREKDLGVGLAQLREDSILTDSRRARDDHQEGRVGVGG
jgi:hypothetical protein